MKKLVIILSLLCFPGCLTTADYYVDSQYSWRETMRTLHGIDEPVTVTVPQFKLTLVRPGSLTWQNRPAYGLISYSNDVQVDAYQVVHPRSGEIQILPDVWTLGHEVQHILHGEAIKQGIFVCNPDHLNTLFGIERPNYNLERVKANTTWGPPTSDH